jgi:hypothetical protein
MIDAEGARLARPDFMPAYFDLQPAIAAGGARAALPSLALFRTHPPHALPDLPPPPYDIDAIENGRES